MDEILGKAQLDFNSDMQALLNICLAVIMYGVSLDLKLGQFRQLFLHPKGLVIGLISQYVVLPGATAGLIFVFGISPQVAAGMLLVAACPGGNVSNFFTHLAKGNVALSVALSLFSTLGAVFLTPLMFVTLSSWVIGANEAVNMQVSFWEMAKTMAIILLIPTLLGLLTRRYLPKLAGILKRPLKATSFLILVGFVAGALLANWSIFTQYIHQIILLVAGHNLLALTCGYFLAYLGGLDVMSRRAVSIETGIQNTGLGLVLVFTFFGGNGAMALIAACWGIWHLLSGFSVAMLFSRTKLVKSELDVQGA